MLYEVITSVGEFILGSDKVLDVLISKYVINNLSFNEVNPKLETSIS